MEHGHGFFPLPFAMFFLLPILDVMSCFTQIRSGAKERESGVAHRGTGEVVAQLLDLDLEMGVALE
jgi:hypothetical protein